MPLLLFSDEGMAKAVIAYLDAAYPSYVHELCKPKHHKLWRIKTFCRWTGVFLQYAKR